MDVNLNTKDLSSIVLPPMPKPEDFGIDWVEAGRSFGIGSPKANRQIEMYEQALATWERVCQAAASRAISRGDYSAAIRYLSNASRTLGGR